MEPVQYTVADIGCYFDGAFGRYNIPRVIDLAEQLGYVPPTDLDESEPDTEDMVWACEEAEAWLNEHTSLPENCYWSFENGDFGLWMYDEDGNLVDPSQEVSA